MKNITKKTPPASFQTYSVVAGNTFDNMDSDVKDTLRTSLILEQKNICAYCERIFGRYRFIEHHCEQSICNGSEGHPDRTLDYTNLLAVCDGSQNSNLPLTCDKKKAEVNVRKFLPMIFNPLNIHHCNTIKYQNSGKISSSNENFDLELNNILNLNAPHLKASRKKKWISILSTVSKASGLDKKKLKKIIEIELGTPNYELDFPGLSNYLLKLFL